MKWLLKKIFKKKSWRIFIFWRILKDFRNDFLTTRDNDSKVTQTENKSRCSNRSTLWKVSSFGTPNFRAASLNALMFSMHAKFEIGFCVFLTIPAWNAFASLNVKESAIAELVSNNNLQQNYLLEDI